MALHLQLPDSPFTTPKILVFGVGGAGGNAINNMISSALEGADFIVANTDAQALEHSLAQHKIQLGLETTKGLGAGASPDVGGAAAQESLEDIKKSIQPYNMVFVTAGMGGGTGTGAAPVIARIAREMGILTVAVVTKPFHFEGSRRMQMAERGLEELQKYVDTLLVIPNQNLFRVANERTTFADAFKMADDVLHAGVRGVTDLMVMPGLINLDFADIRAVMSEMGKAMMGTGEASGDQRALQAAEAAISNPLLDNASMKGAKGVLINITGGPDLTLFEVDEAANRIRDEVDPNANIIFGSTFHPDLANKIRVSVVATGIDAQGNLGADKQKQSAANTTVNPASNLSVSPTSAAAAQAAAQAQLRQYMASMQQQQNLAASASAAPAPANVSALDAQQSYSKIQQEVQREVPNTQRPEYVEAMQKLNAEYESARQNSSQETTMRLPQGEDGFIAPPALDPGLYMPNYASPQAQQQQNIAPKKAEAPVQQPATSPVAVNLNRPAENISPVNKPKTPAAAVANISTPNNADKEPQHKSFFNKVASAARSLTQADENPYQPMVPERKESAEIEAERQDLFDVPAFLRRKKSDSA